MPGPKGVVFTYPARAQTDRAAARLRLQLHYSTQPHENLAEQIIYIVKGTDVRHNPLETIWKEAHIVFARRRGLVMKRTK